MISAEEAYDLIAEERWSEKNWEEMEPDSRAELKELLQDEIAVITAERDQVLASMRDDLI